MAREVFLLESDLDTKDIDSDSEMVGCIRNLLIGYINGLRCTVGFHDLGKGGAECFFCCALRFLEYVLRDASQRCPDINIMCLDENPWSFIAWIAIALRQWGV